MPKLPTNKFQAQRSLSRPMPTKMDRFVENPAHTQTFAFMESQPQTLHSTVAFCRSSSRIRDSQVAPVVLPVKLDPNDGKPFLSLETSNHRVTDNMQKHAPPVLPEGKEYILEPEKFAFAFVDPPKYRLVTKQTKQKGLMGPAERQQRSLQERLGNSAKRQLHRDNTGEQRLVKQLQNRYPRGVLNVEAIAAGDPQVYGPVREGLAADKLHRQKMGDMRMDNLVSNLSRVQYTKYDPIKDGKEAGPYTGPDKWFQSKSRVEGHDSFSRSTRTHDIRPVNYERRQNLRNWESKGRQYNPITGCQIEDCPPNIPEVYESKHLRQTHPSLSRYEKGCESFLS